MLPAGLTVAVTLKAIDDMSRVIETAANGAARQFTQLQEKVKGASEAMQGFGAKAIGVGLVTGAALLKPIEAYANLEDAVTRAKVAFLTGKGLDKDFAKVQEVAEKLGAKLPGTTADFTIMASKLKELGLSTKTIIGNAGHGALEATAYLRVLMGNLAPEQAAELTATFKNSLGIAEKDFVKFVDLVQRQKFAFGVDPTEFAYTLKYIGPQLKQLGLTGFGSAVKLSQFAGALSQAGIKGEQLGTSLRAMIGELPGLNQKIAKSKELAPILKQAGINLQFFDKKGNFMGLDNLVIQLNKLQKLNPQKRSIALKEMFGAEAATAMAEAVGQGIQGYNKAGKILGEQATLQERLKLIMSTLRNTWEAFTGTLENTFARVGESVGDDLKKLVTWLNDVTDATGAWIKAHQPLVRQIVLAVAGFAALSIAVGTVALVLGTIGQGIAFVLGGMAGLARGVQIAVTVGRTLVSVFRWIAFAVRLAAVLLLENPISLAIIAVMAVAVALIYKYWRPITGFFRGLWRGLMEGVKPLGVAFAPIFQRIAAAVAPLGPVLRSLWNWIKALLKPVDDVGGGAEKMGLRFGRALAKLPGVVLNLGPALLSAGAKICEMLAQGITAGASKAIDAMKSVVTSIRAHLPFSPAKVGPLRDIHRIKLVETIASSVRPAPLVAAMTRVAGAARQAVAPAMAPLAAGRQVMAPAFAPVASGRQAVQPAIRNTLAPAAAGAAGRGGSGGNISLTFAPTVHANGASPTVQADIKSQLAGMKHELAKLVKDAMAQRDRTKFEKK